MKALLPHLRIFARHPNVWMMTAALVSALGLRLWLGLPRPWELLIPLVQVCTYPFVEWLIHVHILHFRPRQLGPWTLDLHIARTHRDHHVAPDHLPRVFISLPWAAALVLSLPLIWWLGFGGHSAWSSAWLGSAALTLYYEWMHFIIHQPYSAQSAWMKERQRRHRLHHFKNERYWQGVATVFADDLLRTAPEPASVPLSPTARDLLAERPPAGPTAPTRARDEAGP